MPEELRLGCLERILLMAHAVVLDVERPGQLVPLRHLVRDSAGARPLQVVRMRPFTQIFRVENVRSGVLQRVIEIIGLEGLAVLDLHGGEEPRLIGLDRPAHTSAVVRKIIDMPRRLDPARHPLRRQVAGLHGAVRKHAVQQVAESVGAILRQGIDG